MKVVWMGTELPSSQEAEFKDFITTKGFEEPKIVGTLITLKGQDGEGGRKDLVFEISDKDIPKFALWKLQFGDMTWAEDYLYNNDEIIPENWKQILKGE